MFDISWIDPNRETVGQHKLRKESIKINGGLSRGSSLRSCRSSESTSSHSRPAFLSRLGGGNDKKGALRRTGSHRNLAALRAEDATKAAKRMSSHTVSSDSVSHDSPEAIITTRIPLKGFFTRSSHDTDADHPSPTDASESIFSGWTQSSAATESTWGSVMESPRSRTKFIKQPPSPKSFVTHSTDITVASSSNERRAAVVRLTPAGTIPINLEDSPTESNRTSSAFNFPMPNFFLPGRQLEPIEINDAKHQGRLLTGPVTARTKKDSWKPPMLWNFPEEKTDLISPIPKVLDAPFRSHRVRRKKPPPAEYSQLQSALRKMEAASPKIILERLREEWMEIADASIYRELELEKQRWMLFALRDLKSNRLSTSGELKPQISLPSPHPAKILSMYENHASSSLLSALTTTKTEVHHFSISPLSAKSYPNVRPMATPEYTTQLSYPSNSFASIHAFPLPALFAGSSVPQMLKECHRLLTSPIAASIADVDPPSPVLNEASFATSGGSLHLTIIDPSPDPSTLGPRLRAWLDDHLILSLERQFRCINPSRLFPAWLQDVGLRGEGSMITTVSFLASINVREAESLLTKPKGEDGIAIVIDKDDITKQELKSVVGRILWKEMWGSFVQAEKWWWEDESIIEECERMRTCWEYSIINAVKGDS